MSDRNERDLRRADFSYHMTIPTRWNDNDMLGHVNNVVYYSYFEAAVVRFVMDECGNDWATSPVLPYAAESLCKFLRPVAFPTTVEAGLTITHTGRSSVRYDLALFAEGEDAPVATSHWVHVWVDRKTERPVDIPEQAKAAYDRHTRA